MDTRQFDRLRTWRKYDFHLRLYDTYRRDEYGKHILAYQFFDQGKLIFEGQDFHCSPMHPIDSLDAAYSLLSFLALQPGNTDEEYFEYYTPEQLAWAEARGEELYSAIPDKYNR